MAATLACIAGEEIHHQWDMGQFPGRELGRQKTPFGESGDVFRVRSDPADYFLLARCGAGMDKTAPHRVNTRANLYALKHLGADCLLDWAPGGAITHNLAISDLVILSDLIDQTVRREETYFEHSPLGNLRQFPVFCPELRRRLAETLQDMKLLHHASGIAAVRQGPRGETPAEIRMLATFGAEIVTHALVPELFLARELQMGYAAVCYVTDYAETGSRFRPFGGGGLFKDLGKENESHRLAGAMGALWRIADRLAGSLKDLDLSKYAPSQSQAEHIRQYDLPEDWRKWFEKARKNAGDL